MNYFKSTVVSLVLMLTTSISAQMSELQPLPIDPAVRHGQLENGLTYYIRHNAQPKDRCEFHIAQAVGATLEEDHQDGLAHFLEHMAFNGTTNFPNKMIIEYFESIGVKFGRDINAYTSLDETVYNLSDVPTFRESILDSALLVLHDWSCAISLLEEEIDNERGVIREEWRTGRNAMRRMWQASNELKYPNSQYAKRDVIGDTAVINNFSYQAIRDYYHQWYGPDLQAIIVVGDIDVDAIEKKVIDLFSKVPTRENRGVRPIHNVPNNAEPIVAIVKDKEAQNTRIEIEYKHDPMPAAVKLSQQGLEIQLVTSLISTIINYRFNEMTQKPDANFFATYGAYMGLTKSKDGFKLIALAKEGHERAAMQDLITEAERLKRYGITVAELERAKADILQTLESAYNDRENQTNRDLAQTCIRHYLDADLLIGSELMYQAAQMLLPMIKVEMINPFAQQLVTDENMIVCFMAVDKPEVQIPSTEEVVIDIATIKASQIEAPIEEIIDTKLVDKAPKAAKIKKTSNNSTLGTTEWTLSNGVKVILKPTTFKNDEILLSAHSQGGLSKVANVNDLPSAMFATDVVGYNGLGKFRQIELEKALTGKKASVTPKISEVSEGFSGSSSVKDFETMLQLVYLYFTGVRSDDEAFTTMKNAYTSILVNRDSNPKATFSDSIQLIMGQYHPRVIIVNTETLKGVTQERALSIFKERFATPADFTFFFTGNIDPNDKATQELICTWLGSIKSQKGGEKHTDTGIRTPKGVNKHYFSREMHVNAASNRIVYTGNMDYTLENRLNMNAIGNILSTRYLESIREKEGGSYGVGVRGSVSKYPVAEATLLMQFDTDPDKQKRLMDIIHKEVMDIINDGPRADDLSKVKENLLKSAVEDEAKNEYWSNTILYRYYVDNINYVTEYKKAVEAITTESIKATLKALVEQGNVVEVVMLPTK